MIGAEAADRADRDAGHGRRFAIPSTFAVGPRADVERILENGRYRTIVLWRNEERRIGLCHTGTKLNPVRRGRRLQILIEERELPISTISRLIEGGASDNLIGDLTVK